MSPLDDAAVGRLREVLAHPDLGDERYQLLEPLGEGGMGVVYRAFDRRLQREVAIKLLRPDAVGADDGARLRREAELLARLEHPGVVPVHDVGTTPDGRAFLVMTRVAGRRLDEAVREGLPLGERLRVFLRLCETLAHAHALGIVHRDLKPSNVMIGAFGEVLAMDWGVARRAGAHGDGGAAGASAARGDATRDGTVVGTPGFMAPE